MASPRNYHDIERRVRAAIDSTFPEGYLDMKPVINFSPRYELHKEYWDQILFLTRSIQTRTMTYTTNIRAGAWNKSESDRPKLFSKLWGDFLFLRRSIDELHDHLEAECADRAQQYKAQFGERPNLFGGQHSDKLYGALWTTARACQILLGRIKQEEPLDETFKANDVTGYV